MPSTPSLSRLNALARFQWRFRKDKRGVAAVEFALVAPILILAYLGMAELTLGLMAARRAEHLTSTIGDLASQSDNLQVLDIDDLFDIGSSMLPPFPAGKALQIRLSEVEMNTQNQAVIVWTQNQYWTGAAYTQGTVVPQITTAQLAQGQYEIMTEVEYDYVSPIGNFLPGTTKFKYTFYHHPRNGSQVTQVG
jgi:Flp pilus assembly protein TadG